MSHYTVSVIVNDVSAETLDAAMEPYNENTRVPQYVKKTKEQVIADERESIRKYAESGPYSEYLKDPEAYKAKCGDQHQDHLHYVSEEFPKRLTWTDEECYQEGIRWCEPKELDENGSILSTYNPKSKWDWWVVGGRWPGELLVKEDNSDCGPQIDNENTPQGYKWVDWARIKDVQWKVMEEEKRKHITPWDEFVKNSFMKEEYLRKKYKDLHTYELMMTRFATYSLMDSNGWYEAGEMGWFGMSHAEANDERSWDLCMFEDHIMTQDPEKYIVIIDCHI